MINEGDAQDMQHIQRTCEKHTKFWPEIWKTSWQGRHKWEDNIKTDHNPTAATFDCNPTYTTKFKFSPHEIIIFPFCEIFSFIP